MNTTVASLYVVGTRPTSTPDGQPISPSAVIHNAPRPIYGATTWIDRNPDFRSTGWFFAAIDLEAGDDFDRQCAAEYITENARLDAREMHFIGEYEAFIAGVWEIRKQFSNGPMADKLDGMIADAKYRSHFVSKGLEALSGAPVL